MQRMIILALLLDLSVGALGTATKCAAGNKHKADLTKLTCSSSATDAASCNSGCCEADGKKCGGVTVSCAFASYAGNDDAWKNTATTEKTKNTDCCAPKSTCASTHYTCPAGYKKGTGAGVSARKCSSNAASCSTTAASGCCVADPTTCGGFKANGGTINCGTGKYEGTDKVWKATKTNSAPNTNCCALKATCASKDYSCPAGYKKKAAANPATECGGNGKPAVAASCALLSPTVPAGNTCCEKDPTRCGGAAQACPADKYYPADDTWKAMLISQGCCTAKATCAVATCPSGYKKKDKVDSLSCTGDAASCAVGNKCCEKDNTKCGGLTSITCPYGFYDESTKWDSKTTKATKDAWNNKAATEATKKTACCTAKATCTAPLAGTTTPAAAAGAVVTTTPAAAAAVVTTTPAAPVRLYTEHEVAVKVEQARGLGPNMAYLGVGCLMGMAVIMVAQGLRSRLQVASTQMEVSPSDSREVADILLESPSNE